MAAYLEMTLGLWEKQLVATAQRGKFNAETETTVRRMATFDTRGTNGKGLPH